MKKQLRELLVSAKLMMLKIERVESKIKKLLTHNKSTTHLKKDDK